MDWRVGAGSEGLCHDGQWGRSGLQWRALLGLARSGFLPHRVAVARGDDSRHLESVAVFRGEVRKSTAKGSEGQGGADTRCEALLWKMRGWGAR